MKEIGVLIFMFLFHFIYDFHIQGLLGNMKQKEWWYKEIDKLTDNPYDKADMIKKYKYDYIVSLLIHSAEWSICIYVPIIVYNNFNASIIDILIIAINTIIHAIIDDEKCNKYKLNLLQDQSIHAIQIVLTYAVYFIINGIK